MGLIEVPSFFYNRRHIQLKCVSYRPKLTWQEVKEHQHQCQLTIPWQKSPQAKYTQYNWHTLRTTTMIPAGQPSTLVDCFRFFPDGEEIMDP